MTSRVTTLTRREVCRDRTRATVWEVRLERPAKANALSAEVVEELHRVLDAVEQQRPDVLVLRGNARHFAAGLDLGDLEHGTDASLAHRLLRIGLLLERLLGLPVLTVALVEGTAVGAGADLALACDHRIGTLAASFRFPGARFGAVLGTARLATVSAAHVALDAGRRRDARTALADGLLTRLVEAEPQGRRGHVPESDPEAALDAALDEVLEGWARTAPTARPALLEQSRGNDADAALAALARSVAQPGLRDRVAAFAASSAPRASARADPVPA